MSQTYVYELSCDLRNYSTLLFAEDQGTPSVFDLEAIKNPESPIPANIQQLLPLTIERDPSGYHVDDPNTNPFGDFASLLSGSLLFCLTPAASLALGDLLKCNGVFLPTECRSVDYSAFYTTTTVPRDCLDLKRSDIIFYPEGNYRKYRTMHKKLFFKEEWLPKLPPIFRLACPGGRVMATQEFMDIVEREKLTGLACELVWPHPDPQVERQKWLDKRNQKKHKT